MSIVMKCGGALALLSVAATPATAGTKVVVQPVQVGAETIRYFHGDPTVNLKMARGMIEVHALPTDHGSLAFGVAIFNDGDRPGNFDVGNFEIAAGAQVLPVFSADELEKKAKNRAMWSQIGIAALGGLAAAAAASQRDHYHSTLYTPHGVYRSNFSAPSAAGQVAAAGAIVGTGVGIASIQNQLDETLAAVEDTTIQTTTIDPGDSYGGRIVVAKVKSHDLPQRISFLVHWNGEDYPFAFQVAKRGTPAPAFSSITPPEPEPEPLPEAEPESQPASVVTSGATTIDAPPTLQPAVVTTK